MPDNPHGTRYGVMLSSGRGASMSTGFGQKDRATFATDELAIVLSHYKLGIIEAIQEHPRGSRRSPKLVIRTSKGLCILKRRAKGRDNPLRVAFTHALQVHLAKHQYPMPHLIYTHQDHQTMLQWKGAIYELFEFVKGTSYDHSPAATIDAGRKLGHFHHLVSSYVPDYEPPQGTYHNARIINSSLDQVPRTLDKQDPLLDEELERVNRIVAFLRDAYNAAASEVNTLGITDLPMQVIHGDWHPGNMLFKGDTVVAVVDYDSARIQYRVLDIANGTLQFSILGGGDNAQAWPKHLDVGRFHGFLDGYAQTNTLTELERLALPWLMIEALIAEAAIPIAATGSFARIDGVDFLTMIDRKVRWIQDHIAELQRPA